MVQSGCMSSLLSNMLYGPTEVIQFNCAKCMAHLCTNGAAHAWSVCCCAALTVCGRAESGRRALLAAGAVVPLVMSTMSPTASVRPMAVYGLQFLAADAAIAPLLVESNVLAPLLATTQLGDRTAAHAVRALASLAMHEQCRAAVERCGAVQVARELVHSRDERIRQAASVLESSLALSDSDTDTQTSQADVLRLAHMRMEAVDVR